MNVEVFTIGGGEYIVNVFQAVAAWTGGGGYKSMIRVVMVMGLIYSLLVTAFNMDWRAMMNWFLQSTLIYLCLMVPTVTLKVTDRVNPSLAPAVVANVPLGLGVLASFTSQIGDYLTRSAETVFVMPAQLNYSTNGMIYGSKLMDATRKFEISDPEFAANLNEHMKQCVFYDVLLGFKSMDTLAKSKDLWTDIGPGSPARSQKFVTRQPGGTVDTEIKPCSDAYNILSVDWNTMITAMTPIYAKRLYPKISNAVATAKLTADLPVTYQAFTGNASTALDIMRQHLAINGFMRARDDMSGGTGSAAIDSFAATRADLQAQNTYSAISQGAMKWVPVLNIVLTVVFYAMFPVLFPLFLMPKTGVSTLRGYGMGFFYLAAWGPLYVVLHMILMTRSTAAELATAGGGVTLGSFSGIGAVNDETALLAGYLISSVPFITAGMAKGAMAIAGQATSFLAPSQNAAEAAALEATTGNYAYGNASLANATINSRSTDQWSTAPSFASGTPTASFRNANGTFTQHNADGSTTFNQSPGISVLEDKPTFTQGSMSEMRNAVSQFETQASQRRQMASASTMSAYTTGSQLFDTAQRMSGHDTTTGTQVQDATSAMTSMQRSWSDSLVRDFGWSKETAQSWARASSTGTELNADVAGRLGLQNPTPGIIASISGGASGSMRSGSTDTNTTNTAESATDRTNSGIAFLNQQTSSESANHTRESFLRATANSGDSTLSGLSRRTDASLTEAKTFSREASTSDEQGRRYAHDVAEIQSNGGQWSSDKSQDFVAFQERVLSDPKNPMSQTGYHPSMLNNELTPAQRGVREALKTRFNDEYLGAMRQSLGTVEPLGPSSITGPGFSSAGDVRSAGEGHISSLNAQGPHLAPVGDARDPSIAAAVAGRLASSGENMDRFEGIARGARHGIQDNADMLGATVQARHDALNWQTNPFVESGLGTVGTTVDASSFARSHGVGIKEGANVRSVDPGMLPVITAVSEGSQRLGLTAPTITSGTDGKHGLGGHRTLHPSGRALDFRGNNITVTQGQAWAGQVRSRLGPDYDVVFETPKNHPEKNHLHVEKDPKRA